MDFFKRRIMEFISSHSDWTVWGCKKQGGYGYGYGYEGLTISK